ncbi:MAG: archease [Candidatus Rokuibacteriota bacterium]
MSSADAGYDQFDVEADVGVHGWGPTRADAFAQVALGVLALAVAPEGVAARETREVRAQGDALETLLVNLVNECLYVHEIEGFAVARVEVQFDGEGVAHARLHGEPIDPARHRLGTVVKAATRHRTSVTETTERHEARLIVDV